MHYLSNTSVLVEVFSENGKSLLTATGFFVENSLSELFLVTNFHVVTGRTPLEPTKSKHGAVPTSLKWTVYEVIDGAIRLQNGSTAEEDINDSDGASPRWLEHPTHRYKVDIVAIPLTNSSELLAKYAVNPLNRYPLLEPRYVPSAMDSVFVVGFPWGLTGGGALPLFKRGSIASEPMVPQNGLPRILIDCRTAPRMSGSQVMVSHSGLWNPPGTSGFGAQSVIGTVENFLGVYGGRLEDSKSTEVSDIGVVWRADALTEILERGVPGTTLDQLLM